MLFFLFFLEHIKSIQCGRYEYNFNAATGVLTLTDQYSANYPTCSDFQDRSDIKRVVVQDQVDYLESDLFQNNPLLKDVVIHVNLAIHPDTFYQCNLLTTITITGDTYSYYPNAYYNGAYYDTISVLKEFSSI